MNKTTTFQDLICYAFNETGLRDSDRIQRSIDGDPVVQQEFSELVSTLSVLENTHVQPSEESVQKIIAFSKSFPG